VAAGERADEAGVIVPVAHCQCRQLQARDPALGARLQRRHVLRRQRHAHDLGEKRGGFGGCEAQIGRAQFGQVAPHPQPRERQRRISAAGDDQMQARRQLVQQEGQRRMDRRRFDHMVVIQHQHTSGVAGAHGIEQAGQQCLRRWQPIGHQLGARAREQDLTAMGGGQQTGDAVERWAE